MIRCLIVNFIFVFTIIFSKSLNAAPADGEYSAKFSELSDICTKIFLPNSMTRPINFDIDKYIEQLKIERDKKAIEFSSEKGLDFLVTKITETNEKETYVCAAQALAAIAKNNVK